MRKKDYSAVVFDKDGVIFDTENLRLGIMRKITEELGLNDVTPLYDMITGLTQTETERRVKMYYGKGVPYDEMFKKAADMELDYINAFGPPLKTGVKELMDYLKSEGKLIGLASSGKREEIMLTIGMAGLTEYFDVIVGGDDVQNSKPEPDIYIKAVTGLGIKAENAYAVEDSYNGIKSCHAAGLMPIMVPDRLLPNDDMKKLCTAIYPSLGAFMQALKEL